MKRPCSIVLVCAASAALGCVGLLAWRFDRPPFDLSKLEQLETGMSATAVRQVLGEPSSQHERSWAYSGWLSWPVVYIEFDEDGALAAHRYDR